MSEPCELRDGVCLTASHHTPAICLEAARARIAELEADAVPYCDVCGGSGTDLRTDVEVCRDCYNGGAHAIAATREKALREAAGVAHAWGISEKHGGAKARAALGIQQRILALIEAPAVKP
jgi:hypothetical protein